ncbi:methylmalonyl-CoA mutase family protein [Cesiribacter sp. SM1]|uniref:methylmalonyl-CoA mutase family protein n=1 Tax=Cesiribacter sp. SM1 TaxID=2861196 RepID=UPI001CD6DADC|nr:methylmalonyl-CoA mutase family protein [Cesiribacter sp. SM1]
MQFLFSDFSAADKEQWKKQVLQDLKGKSYDSVLWTLPEGFSLEPYYTAQDIKDGAAAGINLNPPVTEPGAEARQWVNMQYLPVSENVAAANALALEALNGGADGLLFDLRKLKDLPDFHVLLRGVLLEHCTVSFQVEEVGHKVLAAYLQYISHMGLSPGQLQGFIAFDPLGYLSETGLIDNDRLREWAQAAETTLPYPALKGIMLDSGSYHNAGAHAVQEVAFLLSLTAEYMHRLTELGVSPEQAFSNLGYSVALGGRYFVEIAKLRALRYLVTQMAHAYGLENFSDADVYVHAYTGRWSKTRLDVHNNMLRNTTEAMSGILGGCNALTVMPHNALVNKTDSFSLRMARNIGTILRDEAYFGKVNDPVAGAYYPEVLTQKLISESWKLFLQLEKEGDYTKLVEKGRLQEMIKSVRKQRYEDIASRRQRIVGANVYANVADELELPKIAAGATANSLLLKQQGQADAFEALRRRTQEFRRQQGRLPVALLLKFGDPAMSRARAGFADELLKVAGFKIIETYLQAGEAVIDKLSGLLPDVVVLCAADEDYNQQAVWLTDQLRQAFGGVLLVAGNPDQLAPDVKRGALDGFIHLKSNAIQVLTEIQDKTFFTNEA